MLVAREHGLDWESVTIYVNTNAVDGQPKTSSSAMDRWWTLLQKGYQGVLQARVIAADAIVANRKWDVGDGLL
ncbi:hypothetical protein FOA52_010597 [Chlamydomonas sp. UWO 241]|nr:hypothetical protein FOA52_010597 [Chlamydomonas sp. UWO 241]